MILTFFTFWGITTHPWHPKGPRIWKLAKKIFNFIHGLWKFLAKTGKCVFLVSKSKTVVTREWSRHGSKYICLQSLESKLYLTKIFVKNSFWRHLPSTMFWQCILSPEKCFSFQTVFIFTLEDDCNKNWIFFFPSSFWPLKITIFPTFILSFFYTKLSDPNVLYFRHRSKCWYLPLKIAPEAFGDEKWD